MTKQKTKAKAVSFPVPQNRDEANAAIAAIGIAQRERARIETQMNDSMAKIKLEFEEQASPLTAQIEALSKGVQTWCEANRSVLTNDGKVKFAAFAAGEVKWRMTTPKVSIRAVDTVLEELRKRGLVRFIRQKEEPNKEAMLADQDALVGIAGITFSQSEDFTVEPFASTLDAGAA